MHAQAEAGIRPGGESLAGLVGVESVWRVRLAEHVDPARVPSRRQQHPTRHNIDVPRPVLAVTGRYHMGAEERGFGRESGGNLKYPEFVSNTEPVAALDLYGGGAESA